MQRESDLPEPHGVEPVRGPSTLRRLLLIALVAALALAAFRVPIPIFYAFVPGPVRDVETLVAIEGARSYSSEGHLFLTTVSVDVEVTFVDMIKTFVDPHSEIVMRDAVTGGENFERIEEQQFAAMQASQTAAMGVALSALDLEAPTSDGVRIESLAEGSDAAARLAPGDRIVKVDGQDVSTTCDVGRLIDAHDPGENVSITVSRSGEIRTLSVGTTAHPDDPSSPLVGIFMSDINFRFDPQLKVEFDTGEIAGPSAGLMMTLALYDRLTPDDLTGGRAIAGTGEIACDGGVAPIGGITQKVAGAEKEGADVFLVPAANAERARRAADDIRIVAVSNFGDAVDFLEDLE
jgi:PDZ domain-containing protein